MHWIPTPFRVLWKEGQVPQFQWIKQITFAIIFLHDNDNNVILPVLIAYCRIRGKSVTYRVNIIGYYVLNVPRRCIVLISFTLSLTSNPYQCDNSQSYNNLVTRNKVSRIRGSAYANIFKTIVQNNHTTGLNKCTQHSKVQEYDHNILHGLCYLRPIETHLQTLSIC